MTKEEIAENVKKCYNSLPDKSDDAIDTLIATTAFFIAVNVEETSIDEAIMYVRDALICRLKSNRVYEEIVDFKNYMKGGEE